MKYRFVYLHLAKHCSWNTWPQSVETLAVSAHKLSVQIVHWIDDIFWRLSKSAQKPENEYIDSQFARAFGKFIRISHNRNELCTIWMKIVLRQWRYFVVFRWHEILLLLFLSVSSKLFSAHPCMRTCVHVWPRRLRLVRSIQFPPFGEIQNISHPIFLSYFRKNFGYFDLYLLLNDGFSHYKRGLCMCHYLSAFGYLARILSWRDWE